MIEGRRIQAIIPARAGSKGLPRKNMRMLAQRPLAAWTMSAARSSRFIDSIIVSSDDPEVLHLAMTFGLACMERPPELAGDETPMAAVIEHAVSGEPGADIIVLLQVTSPLRTTEHIDGALQKLTAGSAPCVVSVRRATEPPQWMLVMEDDGTLSPLLPGKPSRRQDLRPTYLLNGAIYAAQAQELASCGYDFAQLRSSAFEMPIEASVDIDTMRDFEVAERIMTDSVKHPDSREASDG